MAELDLPGHLSWHPLGVLASISIGTGFSASAFAILAKMSGRFTNGIAATLLTAATAGLHFIAMGALEVVPDPMLVSDGMTFSRLAMAVG